MKYAYLRKHALGVSLVIFVFTLLLCGVLQAGAGDTVIFSNMSGTSSPGAYVVGQYPGTNDDYAIGFPFTPSGSNYRLTQVSVLTSFQQGVNDLIITMYSDSNGKPGSPLESWSVVNVALRGEILTESSLLSPELKAGTQYWLVLSMAVPRTSEALWFVNPLGEESSEAASINGGPYTETTLESGAFEIRGTPLPAIAP